MYHQKMINDIYSFIMNQMIKMSLKADVVFNEVAKNEVKHYQSDLHIKISPYFGENSMHFKPVINSLSSFERLV